MVTPTDERKPLSPAPSHRPLGYNAAMGADTTVSVGPERVANHRMTARDVPNPFENETLTSRPRWWV